jgi:hypothetical protein
MAPATPRRFVAPILKAAFTAIFLLSLAPPTAAHAGPPAPSRPVTETSVDIPATCPYPGPDPDGDYDYMTHVPGYCFVAAECELDVPGIPAQDHTGADMAVRVHEGMCEDSPGGVPGEDLLEIFRPRQFDCGQGAFSGWDTMQWADTQGIPEPKRSAFIDDPCAVAELFADASGGGDAVVAGYPDPNPVVVAGGGGSSYCGDAESPAGTTVGGYFVSPNVMPYVLPLRITQTACSDGALVYQSCPKDNKAECPAPGDVVIQWPYLGPSGQDPSWSILQGAGFSASSQILSKEYIGDTSNGRQRYRTVVNLTVKYCPVNLPIGCMENTKTLEWIIFGSQGEINARATFI